jgi:hypothetical protein
VRGPANCAVESCKNRFNRGSPRLIDQLIDGHARLLD